MFHVLYTHWAIGGRRGGNLRCGSDASGETPFLQKEYKSGSCDGDIPDESCCLYKKISQIDSDQ